MAHTGDALTQKANSAFIRVSMKEPLLTSDHEFELARRWRAAGDNAALHALVRGDRRPNPEEVVASR